MSGQHEELTVLSERDMSRAEWQRGIGAVIFRVVGDVLFQDGDIDPTDMVTIGNWAERHQAVMNISPFWYVAHEALDGMMSGRISQASHLLPTVTHDGFSKFTYFGSHDKGHPYNVIEESARAQVHFPLNLAQIISYSARRQKVEGFSTDTYSQVADVIDRVDFRAMVSQALLTTNGFWGKLSASKGVSRVFQRSEKDDFEPVGVVGNIVENVEFESGNARWSQDLLQTLHENLRIANREGNSSIRVDMSRRTSSGCPARHLQPSPVALQNYEAVLDELVTATGMSRDELTATRETSVVEDGLSFVSGILRNFDAYTSGRLTTYSSSAESPKSTDRLSTAHA